MYVMRKNIVIIGGVTASSERKKVLPDKLLIVFLAIDMPLK
ncbi:hypothetical protein PPEP_b0935 [Pseudoalteromonas peptidolytica F12-50-A1]|uniref:Uncharacterized protein n=1 Tax=Pseudoalteromonas peptidolytica F12-50-A1 TaxID=1315280 RepID=A0A8I0T750_9GAMM|nr:hypothetical protein [Pseudoalteromonas peptidolytica F12-50-A1]